MSVSDNNKLKGLDRGTVLSTYFEKEFGTIHIRALYCPGVRDAKGDLRQWVNWVIALHICTGGQRVYTAFAYQSTEKGLGDSLALSAFCGCSELHAALPAHLLQGLGLAHDRRLAADPAWHRLFMRIRSTDSSFSAFTSQKCFMDQDLAAKVEAARRVLFPKGNK